MEINQDDQRVAISSDEAQSGQAVEARYRKLFQHFPVGMLLIDPEQRYEDVNAIMCQLLGYRADELIASPTSNVIIRDDPQRTKSFPETHKTWQFRRKDRSILSAAVSVSLMPDGNQFEVT